MVRLACVVVVVLLGVFPAAAQERGYLAIDEQGGRHAFSFRGEADAVNLCGTTACEVVASFSSCLGVAYSSPTTATRRRNRRLNRSPISSLEWARR